MPISTKIDCPECDQPLIRKPSGRCPNCGADVRDHVLRSRRREKRIEQVVAIISTFLVIGVSLFAGGCTIVEGVIAYAVAGFVMYQLARKTFF
ncbi:MAG TPA: hypothetical protein VMT89_14150 [Candidatus Acidoferrales bacterium]|nr:hypothetical protein [Candidatus Acidoferrales bacterium]